MATGDKEDMYQRLIGYMPNWFGESHSNLDAILKGYAIILAQIYSQHVFVKKQTRIKSSTGFFLELTNKDFLKGNFPRRPGESDETYANRLVINIIRPRNTRAAYIQVVTDLTGIPPVILEGWWAPDTNALNNPSLPAGMILNVSSLGTLAPYQLTIIAFSPINQGRAVNGLNNINYSLQNPTGATLGSDIPLAITDADIIQAINYVRTAGITVTVYLNGNIYILPQS